MEVPMKKALLVPALALVLLPAVGVADEAPVELVGGDGGLPARATMLIRPMVVRRWRNWFAAFINARVL